MRMKYQKEKMKKILFIALILSVILAACASNPTPQTVYSEPPQSGTVPPLPAATPPESSTPTTITLTDNGRTVNMKAGDSFLLNLGTEMYDWDISIDRQDVLSLHMGVLVVQGAQGLFDAHIPGTATLSAGGNPKCFNSKPPCMMPSIMFTITVVVQ